MSWLALDVGTSFLKAAIIGTNGEVLQRVSRNYPTQVATGGVLEQDVMHWWQAAQEAITELAGAGYPITAIAVTGQMQDVILLDDAGAPVRPVILYSDSRAVSEVGIIHDRLGATTLRTWTGNDQGAGGLLAKLLWLQTHEPDSLKRASVMLLGGADVVVYRLTGVKTSDTTTASTTGLLNIYTRKMLDHNIFMKIGLADIPALLPNITPGGTLAGVMLDEVADKLGLPRGVPVYHGPGDAGASTLGAGSGEPGAAYAYVGTSGWVAFSAKTPADADRGVITLAHPQSSYFIQVAPLLTAGGNLAWVKQLFDEETFEGVIDRAASRPPTSLLYLPYLNGERSPFIDPLARGAFIGLANPMDRSDLYRAVLEGVVYAYRHALEALLPSPVDRLTVIGGGARSDTWCQWFADILNMTVSVVADAEHVGLQGAILAAQVQAGLRTSFELNHSAHPGTKHFTPGTKYREHYDQQYSLFRASYRALKPVFAKLHAPEN